MGLKQEEILQLVTECASGNETSLKRFFEIYSQDIYNFPLKVFHLSEDDASDFFIYAFERLKNGKRFQTFQGKSSFKTWLYTVLRNMLIDWKRNKKELRIVSSTKVNSEGQEYSSIEAEEDKLSPLKVEADEESERFRKALSEIKVENRVIFKLAYIFYLNLEEDEILYIQEKTGFSLEEIRKKILEIRDQLIEKNTETMEYEDKITSIYMNILDLQEQKQKEEPKHFEDNLPYKDRIDLSIQKKYEQRKRLLEKKHKGHFLTRTPFKMITSFLDIPEGGISISLQRVIEKIQKKMSKGEI
ncbi:MAG: RNA polymerase sigma factor [Leptospiraceae bacterium]|nr:RNA polymerase sigma factor [Leptospiraceae bacterium]